MPRALILSSVVTGVIALSGCSPAEPEAAGKASAPTQATVITPTATADVPDAVRAVVVAARPGMVIVEAELKEREGRRYYDVEGTLNGTGIELDLLETPGGWQVVEIQRDIPWSAAPAAVRAAAEGSRSGFTPVRVIESTQAEDGAIIYELFAAGQPATPVLEVRASNGRTDVLKETWPH